VEHTVTEEDTKCPTCGVSDFSNRSYMKRHHKLIHGETLKEKTVCANEDCNKETYNGKFCGQECMGQHRRKYETQTCKRPGCEEEVYKTQYCSVDCANKETWKNRDNPAKRKEVRQKISEKQQGKKNNFYGKTHTEETREKMSNALTGEKHPLYGVTGKDHPSYGVVSGLKLQKVDETGHTVRSYWEKEIDLMLHKAGINYEYESKTFELSRELTYTPDFIVEDKIIEVKGWPNEISKKRAKLFMEKHPEYEYIVVGNKIPCDVFVSWSNRKKLLSQIQDKQSPK